MDEFLQVLLDGVAQGADDDVGADAAFAGEIAIGILEGDVGGIVVCGDADLCAGGSNDFFRLLCGGEADAGEEEE